MDAFTILLPCNFAILLSCNLAAVIQFAQAEDCQVSGKVGFGLSGLQPFAFLEPF
jgi:hypothetical protein